MEVTDEEGASVNETFSLTIAATPVQQPGFEAAAALLGLAAVGVASALVARRRRR